MDDDESIRKLAASLLEALGYEVHVAGDGAEALAVYRQARESGFPFDVVVADLTVPGGMGGREMVEKLLKLGPAAKVIVSSGYAHDPILVNYRQYGFQGVLAKPYRVGDMQEALSRLLSSR